MTPIKLVWKYEGNYPPHVIGKESWALVLNDGEVAARLLRHSDEFMQRVPGISRLRLMRNMRYKDLLPWDALDAGLDKDELFRLSDSGIMTVGMDDVYEEPSATSHTYCNE